jgi:hypothetical protein
LGASTSAIAASARRHLGNELGDVGRAEARADEAVAEPVEVEEVRKEAVELLRLLVQGLHDLVRRRLREPHAARLQRHREADDRGQRRAQLVRDGREDGVAQCVDPLSLGDVLGGADHPDGSAALVRDHAAAARDPAHASVGERDPVLEGERRGVRERTCDRFLDQRAVAGVDRSEIRLVRHVGCSRVPCPEAE